jgi:hypothetical protein
LLAFDAAWFGLAARKTVFWLMAACTGDGVVRRQDRIEEEASA